MANYTGDVEIVVSMRYRIDADLKLGKDGRPSKAAVLKALQEGKYNAGWAAKQKKLDRYEMVIANVLGQVESCNIERNKFREQWRTCEWRLGLYKNDCTK